MSRLIGTEEAAAFLLDRLPPGAAPTLATLRTWCRPSWRRKHPGRDTPRARKAGRVWVWSVEDLEAWVERRLRGDEAGVRA